jgi:ABC-type branched-subunit amino acid transport system ATPase component
VLRGGRVAGHCVPAECSDPQLARLMVGEAAELIGDYPKVARVLQGLELAQPRSVRLLTEKHQPEAQRRNRRHRRGRRQWPGRIAGLLSGEERLTRDRATTICFGGKRWPFAPDARRLRGQAFVPAERLGHGAVPELSLADNALLTAFQQGLVSHGLVQRGKVVALAEEIISRFAVKTPDSQTAARSLSGGNLQKFILGREILQQPKLLVAAHPTWGVDVGAAATIHRALIALRDAGAAILVISEDLDELFQISDRLAALCGGRLSPLRATVDTRLIDVGGWMAGRFDALNHLYPQRFNGVSMLLSLEPRGQQSRLMLWCSPMLAAVLTLSCGSLLFIALGHDPLLTLHTLLIAPVSDWYGVSELLVKALPILLCALGLAVAYQARIWNIGAEGQLLLGALAGSALAVNIIDMQSRWALVLILLTGTFAGAAWAGLTAWLRTRFNANEILTSIMLNYIALNLLLFACTAR